MNRPHVFVAVLAAAVTTGCAHDRHTIWTLVSAEAAHESYGPSEGRVTYVELVSDSIAYAGICIDWYEHGDRPGQPSYPCYQSFDFFALRTLADGWRIHRRVPMVQSCGFDFMDYPEHVERTAEVGLPIPQRSHVRPVIDMRD